MEKTEGVLIMSERTNIKDHISKKDIEEINKVESKEILPLKEGLALPLHENKMIYSEDIVEGDKTTYKVYEGTADDIIKIIKALSN